MAKRLILAVSFLLISCAVFSTPIFSVEPTRRDLSDQEIDDLYEKIFNMAQRAWRDKAKAEEIRAQTIKQIQSAQEILRKAQGYPNDPEMEAVRRTQADVVAKGWQMLVETDRLIQEAERQGDWSMRACHHLRKMKQSPTEMRVSVAALPVFKVGDVKIERPGHPDLAPLDVKTDVLIAGDYVHTGKDGRLGALSIFSRAYGITIGPETVMGLARDTKQGTEWRLLRGVMHCGEWKRPEIRDSAPIRIITPRVTIEPSRDSEFDVYVDEDGTTHVEVYRGEVKQIKNEPDYLGAGEAEEELRKELQLPPRWWETP